MENNKILTIDEIILKYIPSGIQNIKGKGDGKPQYIAEKEIIKLCMIEFAKQHVEKALKNCLEKYHHSIEENYDFGSSEIMNAYDLNNIK
jgi:hypothetical protein